MGGMCRTGLTVFQLPLQCVLCVYQWMCVFFYCCNGCSKIYAQICPQMLSSYEAVPGFIEIFVFSKLFGKPESFVLFSNLFRVFSINIQNTNWSIGLWSWIPKYSLSQSGTKNLPLRIYWADSALKLFWLQYLSMTFNYPRWLLETTAVAFLLLIIQGL